MNGSNNEIEPYAFCRGPQCNMFAQLCPQTDDVFCLNGGECQQTVNGLRICICPAEWAGQYCQQLIGSTSTKSTPNNNSVPAWVAAPIIIGFVVLISLISLLVFLIRRERRGQPVFSKLVASDEGVDGRHPL